MEATTREMADKPTIMTTAVTEARKIGLAIPQTAGDAGIVTQPIIGRRIVCIPGDKWETDEGLDSRSVVACPRENNGGHKEKDRPAERA